MLDLYCPLGSRGWTLQESVLSPRHLYYGTRQIYWKCVNGFQAADGTPEGAKTPSYIYRDISSALYADILKYPSAKLPERESILNDYYDLVKSYCQRKLTYDLDKLPAFSGVAHRLQPVIGGQYVAGIWTSDFRNGLLWYSEMKYCYHAKKYRAPSWSWAATDQPVLFSADPLPPSPTELQLIDYKVTLRDASNPFGEILAAELLVKGLTFPIVRSLQVLKGNNIKGQIGNGYWDDPLGEEELQLKAHSLTDLFYANTGGEKYILSILAKTGTAKEFDVEMDKFCEEQYLVLLIHTDDARGGEFSDSNGECLVLRPVPGKTDVYERVGYLAL